MALQNRPAMWGRSIVSNCYGDGGCITTKHAATIRQDPARLEMERHDALAFEKVSSDPRDPAVATWLRRHGIQRVVVGHKPTADCPAVLSAVYTGVEIVSADTSFSDTTAIHDNRGAAVAGVEIVGTSEVDNQLVLAGVLRDGTDYAHNAHVRLHPPDAVDTTVGDANLGTQLRLLVGNNNQQEGQQEEDIHEEWWIKAAVDEDYYLTRGNGRHVEYKRIPKAGLAASNGSSLSSSSIMAQNSTGQEEGDVAIQVQA